MNHDVSKTRHCVGSCPITVCESSIICSWLVQLISWLFSYLLLTLSIWNSKDITCICSEAPEKTILIFSNSKKKPCMQSWRNDKLSNVCKYKNKSHQNKNVVSWKPRYWSKLHWTLMLHVEFYHFQGISDIKSDYFHKKWILFSALTSCHIVDYFVICILPKASPEVTGY